MDDVRRAARHGLALLALAVAPALAGCATIFTGTTDVLRFDANVPGVRLTIDGQYKGELPLTVELSRNFVGGKTFLASFEAPGYVDQRFMLAREFNGAAILDITSPVTSGGIDLMTGSLMRFSPLEYHVHMLPDGTRADAPGFRRDVALHAFALANWRSLQKDLARGGGEHLSALGLLVAGDDPVEAGRIGGSLLVEAPGLVAASSAPGFVARLREVLPEFGAARPD
jgi:hypothetical protein